MFELNKLINVVFKYKKSANLQYVIKYDYYNCRMPKKYHEPC